MPFCQVYMVNHPSSIWSLFPCSVANIFGNWLHGIDNRFRTLIRVGALAISWLLWLCRNDKVFNAKIYSSLQVIYRCTSTLHLWSSSSMDGALRPVYKGMCTIGDYGEVYFFPDMGGSIIYGSNIHHLSHCCSWSLCMICNSPFSCMHLSYAEDGCNA
jgi:hypothetical protein